MNYYNKISKGYDELYKEEQLKKLSIIKNNIKIIKNNLLLDVGCGTGISSQFNCKVIGIDNSIELLKINKNKNKILSNAENLPFKDNIFDIVVSITALHNFDNVEKSLKEIKRVGKNEFIFSVLKMSEFSNENPEHAQKPLVFGKSKKFNEIKKLIKKYFKINKIIEEEKDTIFLLKQKLYK